jgi:hypothetical protein
VEEQAKVKSATTALLHAEFTLVSCLAYYTLKVEEIYSAGKPVDFQRTARRCNPEALSLLVFSVHTAVK